MDSFKDWERKKQLVNLAFQRIALNLFASKIEECVRTTEATVNFLFTHLESKGILNVSQSLTAEEEILITTTIRSLSFLQRVYDIYFDRNRNSGRDNRVLLKDLLHTASEEVILFYTNHYGDGEKKRCKNFLISESDMMKELTFPSFEKWGTAFQMGKTKDVSTSYFHYYWYVCLQN
jgi:hypothetical protein